MPFVITPVAIYASAYIGGTIAFWEVVTTLALVAAQSGVSRSLAKKARNSVPSLAQQALEVNVRNPAAAREIVYGYVRKSGVFYPVGTSGANNEYLHVLLLVAGHEVDNFGEVYFNDEPVPIDGSGNATGRYAGYVRIKKHLGAYDQTVDTDLQSDLGSSYWSNDHRLRGIAYIYLRLKVSQELFAGGIPEIYVMTWGRKMYDWRDAGQNPTDATTWLWNDNAAICRADWIRGVPTRNSAGTIVRNHGLGAPDDEIDETAIEEAANTCDEDVTVATAFTRQGNVTSGNRNIVMTTQAAAQLNDLYVGMAVSGTGIPADSRIVFVNFEGASYYFTIDKDPTSTGTNRTISFGDIEHRYNINGVISTSVRAGDGIESMKTADAGDAVWIGGKWIIRSGSYRTPTVTITDSDLRGPLQGVRLKPSRRDIYNQVRGVFISSHNNWQPADFPKVSNSTYKTQDGGEDLPADIELPFTNTPAAAQRLAKILMERSRQGIAFTARCKLTALQNQCTDVVQVTNARFGWTDKPFEVVGFKFVVEDDETGSPYLGVDLTLRETASGVWDWASGEETTIDLAPNTNLPNPFSVEPPTGLSVVSSTSTAETQTDGTALPRLLVTWTAPADANVTNGGNIRLEYKASADSAWLPWSTPRGDQVSDLVSGIIIAVDYDVRIRSENVLGAFSAWVEYLNTTAVGVADPAAPTSISLSNANADLRRIPAAYAGAGGAKFPAAMLKWVASASSDVVYYNIRRVGSGTASLGRTRGTETEFPVYSILQVDVINDTIEVQAVSGTGRTSTWLVKNPLHTEFSTDYGTLAMAEQAPSAVAITGGTITGITDIAVADGGTGASTASAARTNLGVTATGADTNYAFRSNNLSDLASASTARTNLGLGSIATQAASNVTVTGGSVTGITDLAIADGGTGASSASAARTNLGLGTAAVLNANAMGDTTHDDITATGDIVLTGSGKNIKIGDGALMKTTPGGWGPYLYDGTYLIEIRYTGTQWEIRANGGTPHVF